MRDIAAVSAELEALNEVEEDDRGMLPSDDEIVRRQHHLQQYLEVQSKDVSPLQSDSEVDEAMPHKCVTFLPKHGSNGKSHSLMNEEGLGVSRGTNVNAQAMNLNPLAHSFIPPSNYTPTNNVKQSCRSLSTPGSNPVTYIPVQGWSLPPIEPPIFSGEPMEFPLWIKKFKTFVEARTIDASERLAYLDKYTSGEAKEAIRMLMYLNTNQDYDTAKRILWQRFGNESVVANAYMKWLSGWPQIPQDDGPALMKFSDFFRIRASFISFVLLY